MSRCPLNLRTKIFFVGTSFRGNYGLFWNFIFFRVFARGLTCEPVCPQFRKTRGIFYELNLRGNYRLFLNFNFFCTLKIRGVTGASQQQFFGRERQRKLRKIDVSVRFPGMILGRGCFRLRGCASVAGCIQSDTAAAPAET